MSASDFDARASSMQRSQGGCEGPGVWCSSTDNAQLAFVAMAAAVVLLCLFRHRFSKFGFRYMGEMTPLNR